MLIIKNVIFLKLSEQNEKFQKLSDQKINLF